VPGNGTALDLHGTGVDQPARVDQPRRAPVRPAPGPGPVQRAPGAQLLGQVTAKHPAVGQVQALVDRLGTHDALGVVGPQVADDLLGAPLQLKAGLDDVAQPHIRSVWMRSRSNNDRYRADGAAPWPLS